LTEYEAAKVTHLATAISRVGANRINIYSGVSGGLATSVLIRAEVDGGRVRKSSDE